jgi:hypothetical protein
MKNKQKATQEYKEKKIHHLIIYHTPSQLNTTQYQLQTYLKSSTPSQFQMKQSILPPLHINTIAATAMRTPSTVLTLVVVWIEAQMTLPHFCLKGMLVD